MKYKLKTLALAATIALFSVNSASANAVPYCREYTETFQIGGRTERGYGTACLQPDGSWEKQGSNYDNPFELQKENVVYVIDRQPVEIYRPGYRPYGYNSYRYSQPSTFFSLSFNDGYRSRPYYYHNRGHHHNHRGHGYGHGHGWKDKGDRGRGHGGYGKREWH